MNINLKQLKHMACNTRVHCKACRSDSGFRSRVTGVSDFECPYRVYWDGRRVRRRSPGLGDMLASLLKKAGVKQKPGCGCSKRQEKVNRWWERILSKVGL